MSGHAVLSGKRAQRACTMLRVVTDVLDAAGVRYWLDSGTLLGVVREQRLLPWDTDMDISIDSTQLPIFKTCVPDLKRLGFRVRMRTHAMDDGPFRKAAARLFKVRDRRWFFFRGELLLDVFVQYRIADHYFCTLSQEGNDRRLSAPARFFDSLEQTEFQGKRYPVPADTFDYLRHRYGNWQKPVKDWSVFADDLAMNPLDIAPDIDLPAKGYVTAGFFSQHAQVRSREKSGTQSIIDSIGTALTQLPVISDTTMKYFAGKLVILAAVMLL